LRFRSFNHSAPSKHESVILLRSLMRDRQLACVDDAEMRRQLLTFPRRVVGGGFQYGGRRSGSRSHWDRVSALITLMHLLNEERGTPSTETSVHIQNSPTQKQLGGRFVTGGR
jgi:hypothetical protein